MTTILAFISASVLSFVLTIIFRAVARRLKIIDNPDIGKVHKEPTPLLGGVAIYIAFTAVILFGLNRIDPVYKVLYIGGALIFVTGLIDDLRHLPAAARLLIQIVTALFVINNGISFTFLPNTPMGRIGESSLTVLWIVGMINAFNFLDGLDGLLSGVAIISAAFFFIFTFFTSQAALAFVLAVFAGACAGFFLHNFPKGRIFMGDAGSAWLGFMLAGLAVIGDWAEGKAVDLVIPILIFGVPIFDMVNTTVTRICEGKVKNIIEVLEYKGRDHFHYKLSQIGLGNRGAVLFIFLTCVFLGLNGLLLAVSSNLKTALIVLCACSIFFILITLLMAASRKNE